MYLRSILTINLVILVFFFPVEMNTVVCEDDAKCNLLLEKSPRCLKRLIVIKEVRPATKQRAKNRGVDIYKFSDVEIMGTKSSHPDVVSEILFFIIIFSLTNIIIRKQIIDNLSN